MDWMTAIRDDLQEHAQRRARPQPQHVMYKVRRQLRELKSEHYEAQDFSFVLLNRSPLDAPKTRADNFRIEIVSTVLEIMGMTARDDWERLCEMVVPRPEESQDLYDEVGRDRLSLREVQSVLSLDAVFLAFFLGCTVYEPFWSRFQSSSRRTWGSMRDLLELLLQDLWKVENQIPLSLIRTALTQILRAMGLENPITVADTYLLGICQVIVSHNYFTGIPEKVPRPDIQYLECDHFFGCVYRHMCHGLTEEVGEVQDGDMRAMTFLSATQLQKVGIEFRGRPGTFHEVEFKPGLFKGILFLPELAITDATERMWRNLMAYEDTRLENQQYGGFTNYLLLMDRLIDAPQDVALLKSGRFPVIVENFIGSDEAVARIFNNCVIENSIQHDANLRSWRELDRQIDDFYKLDRRRMYLEFIQTKFGKTWLTVSVLAAISLLI